MALKKQTSRTYRRRVIEQGENNDLRVTGVEVLINLRCSNATEQQILSRLREIMEDDNEETSEDEICQQIEKLFKEEFSSYKTSINRKQEKRKSYIHCPFAIHINPGEESGSFEVSIRDAEDMEGEEIMEVLKIKVRRKLF